jgi:hypothetical protein
VVRPRLRCLDDEENDLKRAKSEDVEIKGKYQKRICICCKRGEGSHKTVQHRGK